MSTRVKTGGAMVLVTLAVAAWQVFFTTGEFSVTSFSDNYQAAALDLTCTDTSAASQYVGREPDVGKHPLFVWITGTGGDESESVALTAIETAAKLGHVAISVDYLDVTEMRTDPGYDAQAECIFDSTRSTSAVAEACARPRADCNRGIVIIGHSMGGIIATYARNAEPLVKSAIGMGLLPFPDDQTTTVQGWGAPLSSFQHTSSGGKRQLPHADYRIMNGEYETENNFGFASAGSRVRLNDVFALDCQPELDPDSTHPYEAVDQCLNADDSGWYLVQDESESEGQADHCWFHANGCSTVADDEWLTNPPDEFGDLRAMIAWLDERVE